MHAPTTSLRPTAAVIATAVAVVLALLPAPGHAQQPVGGEVLFPTDALTVADPAQRTGRRVQLPQPADCALRATECDDVRLLNQLDGFDLLPRVTVQLDAPPGDDLQAQFPAEVLGIREAPGGQPTGDPVGLARMVYDPATMQLHGEPARQLRESTTHAITFDGTTTTFTTLTASAGLAQMRRQLDDGSAYAAAGIGAADRGMRFTQGELRTAFPAQQVATITRYDEVTPGGALRSAVVPDSALAGAGTVAFGSFTAPSWIDADVVIDAGPTGGRGPAVRGADVVGVTLITPSGTPPEGGWPLAVFGPGITRSKYDLFLAADLNAARGLATMSFDPVGHAYGSRSEIGIQLATAPGEVRFQGFGRGRDLNDDGVIGNSEGVQAPAAPHPQTSVGLRDGLRQTAADLMALVRAVQAGADVDGDGDRDLSGEGISLYAQSLGGIYSTMLMGVDPAVEVAALNVPGGSILDIARVSPGFRSSVQTSLRNRVPGLLNGGINQFDESIGLFGIDPPTTDPADGALAIQEVVYSGNWINRPGSPEAFAPLIALDPLSDSRPKKVMYQLATGDQTVPNPASFRLVRALGQPERVTLFRNDLTASRGSNPHGFLLDPTIQGRNQAQQQILDYLLSGGDAIGDPDGPLPTWEAPIADLTSLQARNFPAETYAPAAPAPARDTFTVEGSDPILAASLLATEVFDGAEVVVLSRDDAYADGLAGGPLAATLGAPLLLTGRDRLAMDSASAIQELGAERAVLLGGESAIGPDVAAELEANGIEVERIGGTNRFETAALVAERIGYRSEVLLVEGENADPARGFPDALSAAGIGAALGLPILLVNATRLPQETADALQPTQDVTVVGGTAAVTDAVVGAVDALAADVRRVAGGDRYATTAAAATDAIVRGVQPTTVYLTSGRSFAVGLAAGAAAGATDGIALLVDPDDLDRSAGTARWLRQHARGIDVATVAGLRGTEDLGRQVQGVLGGELSGVGAGSTDFAGSVDGGAAG